MSYATVLPNGLRLPEGSEQMPPPPTRLLMSNRDAGRSTTRAPEPLLRTPSRSRRSPTSGAGPMPPSSTPMPVVSDVPSGRHLSEELFTPEPIRHDPSRRGPNIPQEKGDFSDPPQFPGFSHYRLWKKAIKRWDALTDVKSFRRAEKVLRLFSYDLQQRLEHLTETELQSARYLDLILEVLDLEAGDHAYVEKKRVVREALFDHSRARDESMAQYVHRRMQQFLQAESLGIHIPAEIRGTMLEEGAQLSEQGMQNLRTLTKGSTDFSVVKRALLDLDIPRDRLLKKSMMVENSQEDTFVAEEDSGVDSDGELFDELAGMDLDETQAAEVFAILEKNHFKRRTWKENKDLRKAIKKDRQHFDRMQGPQKGNGKGKSSTIDRLKAITKCSNCGMKGHWHRECPNASDGRGSTSSGSMAPPSVGFTYAGFGRESFSTFLSEGDREVLQMIKDSLKIEPGKDERACLDVFLSLRTMSPGLALADIGAGEDLIGLRAFQELSQALGEKGWTAPQLSITPKPASGVGGDAKALYYVILPIQLGGTLGFVRTEVLDNNIPHLLSVGLLDHVGAIIDLPNNSIKYQNSNHVDKMHKLDSGHRAVQVVPSSPFTKEVVSAHYSWPPEDHYENHDSLL